MAHVPILSDAVIAEALLRARHERFHQPDRSSESFPVSDVEALESLNRSGYCQVGWINSWWEHEAFDVWLNVDTARVHCYRTSRLRKRDQVTRAALERITDELIAERLAIAAEELGEGGAYELTGVHPQEVANAVAGVRPPGWACLGWIGRQRHSSDYGETLPVWFDIWMGECRYGAMEEDEPAGK